MDGWLVPLVAGTFLPILLLFYIEAGARFSFGLFLRGGMTDPFPCKTEATIARHCKMIKERNAIDLNAV